MALTKIGGGVLRQPIDVGIITATSLNASGIVTAGTVQVGAATTVHSAGIDLGSGNITSHNINSTGIITATSFVGPVTGNTSGTASNLSGSPSINVTNITASGNVSIAGTLTYEDVTNIDSVGIITAQAGIRVTGGSVGIGLTNPEKNLVVSSSSSPTIRINNSDGSISADQTIGVIEFKANDGSNDGSQVTGSIESISQAAFTGQGSPSHLIFKTNGVSGANALTERLRITAAGLIGIGNDNPTVALDVKRATAGLIGKFYDTGSNGGALYNGGPILGLSRVSNGSVSLDGLLFQVGIDNSNSTSYNIDSTIFSVTNRGVGIGINNPSSTYLLEADGPIRSGSSGSSLPKGAGFRQHAACTAGVSNRLIYNAFDSHYAEKSFGYYFPNGQSNRALRIHSNRNSWWTCGFITIHAQYSNANASGMLRYEFTHNANGTSSYGKSIDVNVNRGSTSAHFGMSSSYSFKTWGSNGGSATSHALEIRHLASSGNSCYVTIEMYGSSASTYIDDLYMTTGHTY